MSEAEVCRATVTLRNMNGLHARPAHMLVQIANAYAARLEIERDGVVVDGKSIMSVMMLAAEAGSTLELRSVGPDCEAQIAAVRDLVDARFGEDG